jgi:mannose-6-phosphate isomerase
MLKLNAIQLDKIWGYEQWIASTHENGLQQDLLNAMGGNYPLLVKIIQANENLSIQVHPDDDSAKLLEGNDAVGKTEC